MVFPFKRHMLIWRSRVIDFARSILFTGPSMIRKILGTLGVIAVASCTTGVVEKDGQPVDGAKINEAPPVRTVPVADKPNKPGGKVDFVKQIKPIFEYNCLGCHRDEVSEEHGGGYTMDIKEKALRGRRIKPGDHESSSVWETMTLPLDDEEVMPPKEKEDRPTKEEIDLVARWIDEGAEWPDGLQLKPRKRIKQGPDENKIVAAIHQKIIATRKKENAPTKEADMKPFKDRSPDMLKHFEMVPIKGGEFLMGSPADEKGRADDEGPQRRVKVSPFWIGKHEVTWDSYHKFMYYKKKEFPNESDEWWMEQVATPTNPYVNMDFGMGTGQHPAISMTQHAANKYCQWLSAKTGHFYRLPTEAEWEYACRAGTKTAYNWGDEDDRSTLNANAINKRNVYDPVNFQYRYREVGTKKPNAWGLFDMHGNVAEWVLDGYAPYKASNSVLVDPWVKGTKPYPHVARGGSFHPTMDMTKLRSAARIYSTPGWKQQDPQLPKSIWYLTDATFLGLRIVRPLKTPSAEEMKAYWNNGVEYDIKLE